MKNFGKKIAIFRRNSTMFEKKVDLKPKHFRKLRTSSRFFAKSSTTRSSLKTSRSTSRSLKIRWTKKLDITRLHRATTTTTSQECSKRRTKNSRLRSECCSKSQGRWDREAGPDRALLILQLRPPRVTRLKRSEGSRLKTLCSLTDFETWQTSAEICRSKGKLSIKNKL